MFFFYHGELGLEIVLGSGTRGAARSQKQLSDVYKIYNMS